MYSRQVCLNTTCPLITQEHKEVLQNIRDFARKYKQPNLEDCVGQLLHRCVSYISEITAIYPGDRQTDKAFKPFC